VAQVTISEQTKNSQLHAARPEVLRAGAKNIQEERGSWHLAGKVVQSYIFIQTWGQTNKQTKESVVVLCQQNKYVIHHRMPMCCSSIIIVFVMTISNALEMFIIKDIERRACE
jgi:hypothetical protein